MPTRRTRNSLSPEAGRLQTALTKPESDLRKGWVTLLLDTTLDRPILDLLPSSEQLTDWLVEATTVDNLERLRNRHGEPAWHRLTARAAANPTTVHDWLGEALVAKLQVVVWDPYVDRPGCRGIEICQAGVVLHDDEVVG